MCAKQGSDADAHDAAAAFSAATPAPSLAASSKCSAGREEATTATRSACFVGPIVGLMLGASVGQYVTIVRRSA